jgi:hypothetical protein
MAFDLSHIPNLIAAVGALGLASMGVVESLGKTLLVYDTGNARQKQRVAGLPYAGYGSVQRLIKRVAPALKVTYGDQYASIIAEQYRNGRGGGQAPDTIRQGVRLGLPYLSQTKVVEVASAVWGLHDELTTQFARGLLAGRPATQAPPASSAATPAGAASPSDDAQAAQSLAARFATALDTAVDAAFNAAEADYQSWVRFWAGVAAVSMAIIYYVMNGDARLTDPASWIMPVLVGLVAVPLAPVAKDLSTGISQAITALGQIRSGGKTTS